jgi:hypothetical protein
MEDVEIARLKNLERMKSHQDIYGEEVWIDGGALHFAPKYLFDGAFSVFLPAEFPEMSESMKKSKYPTKDYPAVVHSNPMTDVNIGFNLLDVQLAGSQVESAVTGIKSGISESRSDIKILTTDFLETKTHDKIGYFDFITPSQDGPLYQMLAFLSMHGKYLQTNCNCREKSMETWNPIFIQILLSIKPEVRKS